jgi:hypothetical protein
MHPLKLCHVAQREARCILSALQAHPEPLVSQEPPLVNGIIHANGQVQPLNGLQHEQFYTFGFIYWMIYQFLSTTQLLQADNSPWEMFSITVHI